MNTPSSTRWEQIDRLFEEALLHPPAERAAVLRRQCGSHSVYQAVTELLEQFVEAKLVLGESVADFANSVLAALTASAVSVVPSLLEPGSRIGPYQLLDEIGNGGMGVVYLAERHGDPSCQKVALKLARGGMQAHMLAECLQSEQRILASLEHPSIARFYDSGTSADGHTYLVMEYVHGQPIDHYCDANRFSVDARLALFSDVCEAVQYAHRCLVVHCDLKPSNILITDRGLVKLIDFGIATQLRSDSTPSLHPLHPGRGVMTREYAAPEQRLGATPTPATDVYALGVLLYELVVGRRPFDAASRTTTARRPPIVMASRAVLPHHVLQRHLGRTTERTSSAGVSADRGTTLTLVRPPLQGELDRILRNALRRAPEQRYPTVSTFLTDIQRHLAERSVVPRSQQPQ